MAGIRLPPAENAILPIPWQRIELSRRMLMEEALESLHFNPNQTSGASRARRVGEKRPREEGEDACAQARRDILAVLGRDEAWLASCVARSKRDMAALSSPEPLSPAACILRTSEVPLDATHETLTDAALASSQSDLGGHETGDCLPSTPQNAPSELVVPVVEAGSTLRPGLTAADAVVVFLLQLGPRNPQKANLIAREFGITSKAVRDVWTQKSWVSVTTPFWTIVHGPSLASLQAHCQESGRERARGHGGVPLDVRGL